MKFKFIKNDPPEQPLPSKTIIDTPKMTLELFERASIVIMDHVVIKNIYGGGHINYNTHQMISAEVLNKVSQSDGSMLIIFLKSTTAPTKEDELKDVAMNFGGWDELRKAIDQIEQNEAEASYDSFVNDYYGSDKPVTMKEQAEEAYKTKYK